MLKSGAKPQSCWRSYLTDSVYQLVLQKSIPIQLRQLILHISNSEGQSDGFVRELISAKRL